MMRRRTLLMSMGAVLAAPLTTQAQQVKKVPKIGFLSSLSPSSASHIAEALRHGLRELGYIEGHNIAIEYRYAEGVVERRPNLAAELVKFNLDLIVAHGNPATLAAKTVTTTIPIVALGMLEPVETGIVTSLARPGGNVTGVTFEESTAQVTKKLDLFKELVPRASRMAAVWDPTLPGLARYWPPFRTAATALGMAVCSVEYTAADDFDRTFAPIRTDS